MESGFYMDTSLQRRTLRQAEADLRQAEADLRHDGQDFGIGCVWD